MPSHSSHQGYASSAEEFDAICYELHMIPLQHFEKIRDLKHNFQPLYKHRYNSRKFHEFWCNIRTPIRMDPIWICSYKTLHTHNSFDTAASKLGKIVPDNRKKSGNYV